MAKIQNIGQQQMLVRIWSKSISRSVLEGKQNDDKIGRNVDIIFKNLNIILSHKPN